MGDALPASTGDSTSYILDSLRVLVSIPIQWDTATSDVYIDDWRVRKVLGYRNRYSNAQTVSGLLCPWDYSNSDVYPISSVGRSRLCKTVLHIMTRIEKLIAHREAPTSIIMLV